jgi:hypothetical protein
MYGIELRESLDMGINELVLESFTKQAKIEISEENNIK